MPGSRSGTKPYPSQAASNDIRTACEVNFPYGLSAVRDAAEEDVA